MDIQKRKGINIKMKVAVINGQSHHGNTYQVTHLLLDKLNCTAEEVKEFDVN